MTLEDLPEFKLNTESLQKLQRFRSKTEKLIKIGKKCSCSSLCCWFTLYVNGGGAGRGGAEWGNTQTRLIHFYPIPLGAGRGGYPKKPAPLPSLNGTKKEDNKSAYILYFVIIIMVIDIRTRWNKKNQYRVYIFCTLLLL